MADAAGIMIGAPVRVIGSVSTNSFSLNQTTDQLEFIVSVDEAATITRLGVRLTSITGTTPTYKISIQGVDASGFPDGTIKGGGSPASATFSPSGLSWSAGTWHWITLDNSYAAARGEMIAIVVSYASGSVDASNFASFTATFTVTAQANHLPMSIQNDNGTRTKSALMPVFGYGSSGKAYGNPCQNIASQTVSQIASPDEFAIKFTLPAAWGDTFKIGGVMWAISPASASTIKFQLFDGGGASDLTVLQDVTWDTDHRSAAANDLLEIFFDEVTLSTLTFGNTYRLSMQPQTSSIHALLIVEVASVDDWSAWPGGSNFTMSTRLDLGNWTDVDTKRICADLILADWTEPAGGSGGLKAQRHMAGGLV